MLLGEFSVEFQLCDGSFVYIIWSKSVDTVQ